MAPVKKPIRILYSFPHKLGADRICYTAWQQVNGVASAGGDLTVFPGVLSRPVLPSVRVRPTLAKGKLRIPYKLLGRNRALALHDYIVACRLDKIAAQIDIVHVWPQAALRTLAVASRLGIPTVLERCNAHTQYAMHAVKNECVRLGMSMPRHHEHAEDPGRLRIESEEYRRADRLVCPSDFVVRTFLEEGFAPEKLARHQYGFDEKLYSPSERSRRDSDGMVMLFVGACTPRKGLHYALDAWLRSPAHANGKFLVAGKFIPGYAEKLSKMLSHPSVHVLGHRTDISDLMQQADVLVLPTIEEGSALVTYEARGSGCVLLVSNAAGAVCEHMKNALVHNVADVATLTEHITMLYRDPELLKRLRTASLSTLSEITWTAAGVKLLDVYRETMEMYRRGAHAEKETPAKQLERTSVSS